MDEEKKDKTPKLSKSLPPFDATPYLKDPSKPIFTEKQVIESLRRNGGEEAVAFYKMSPEERDRYIAKKNSELKDGPIRDYKNGPDDAGIGEIWGLNGDD